MSTSKIERALHGPSWTEVLFGAVLSALLGVILAAAYLVLKPVSVVSQLPKELVPNQVYYVQGSPSRGSAWAQKRLAIVAGQSVDLNEEELNAAAAAPAKDGKAPPPPAQDGMLVPSPLSFRVADGAVQLGMSLKVTLLETNVVLQAKGGFERSGSGFSYAPEVLFLGSLPAHRLPVMKSLLLGRIKSANPIPEDLSAAWDKLSAITVEGKQVKLSF